MLTENLTPEEMSGKIATLEASLLVVTTERDTLKATQSDFDRKLACALAKHGIRDTAIATHAGGKPILTMTDISAAVVAGTLSKDDALALSREIAKASNGAGDLKKIPFPVV